MSDAFISYFLLLVTILFAKINVFIVSILMPLVFTYGIYSVFKKESLFSKKIKIILTNIVQTTTTPIKIFIENGIKINTTQT